MKVSIALIVFLALSTFTSAKVLVQIDEFNENIQPVFVIVTNGNADPDEYLWYSPYPDYVSIYTGLMNWAGDPEFSFSVTDKALGGHRDLVLGHQTDSPSNSIASLTIVGEAASLAFPLLYAGGCYVQWDGDDTGGDATQAFPGVTLNTVPGIGQGEAIGKANGAVDFTFGGRALGLTITIVTDHTVNYFMDAIDSAGNFVSISFLAQATSARERYFFRFDDPDWETLDGSTFDFTDVAGFQVRIFTFSDGAGGTTEQAVDTEFSFIQILGYEVSGTVVIDCLCDGLELDPVENELIEMFNRGSPTPFATATTDATGFYNFDVFTLTDGLYTVCLADQAQDRCETSVVCYDIVLEDFVDVINLDFFLTTETSLVLPPDEDFECGNCIDPFNPDPTCPDPAIAVGCDGVNTPLTTFTDSSTFSNNGCVQTISRRWTDPDTGESGIQTITLTDTQPPILVTPASDRTQDCSEVSTYANWISTRAGADATDCTDFSWSVSPNSEPFRCDSETVTFTATDPCGFSVATTATYTVFDNEDPIFSGASVEVIECTASSSSTFNSWLNSIGGSTITDNCAVRGQTLDISNDFVGPFGDVVCTNTETVTWMANDNCGNMAVTTGSFTIEDTQPPVITTPARDETAQCNANVNQFNAWLQDNGGARASDACTSATFLDNNDPAPADGCDNGTPVTFTVVDECGNSAQTTATFSIVDNVAPFFSPGASNLQVQCDGTGNTADYNNWLGSFAGAVPGDACSGFTVTDDAGTPPTDCNESVTVTFSVNDACGNGPVRTTATFTIIDNIDPFFVNSPTDSSAECSPSAPDAFDAWLLSFAGATINDDCSQTLTITDDYNGNGLNNGCLVTQTVRFFANDGCGNTSPPQTATFTISDNTDPILTNPGQSESVECNLATNQQSYQSFIQNNAGATATDSCGTIFWTNDGPANVPSGCTANVPVIFVANDGCGNIVSTTQSFSISDNTPPTLINPASDMTVECNGNGNTNDLNNWLNSNGGASANDNCGPVQFTNDFVSLSGGCTQTAFVTFTVCDSCNLCVDTSATFTATDTRGPVISPQASNPSVECDPNSNQNAFDAYVADNGGARATDACNQDSIQWSASFNSSPFGCDSEIVTFTVTDNCGQNAVTTGTFTILDSVAPVFTNPPEDLEVECDGNGNVNDYQNWLSSNANLVVEDVCAITISVINNAPVAGPVGCGTQIVQFTAEDECLNAATDSAVFRVVDTSPPTVSPASDMNVECDSSVNQSQLQSWLDNNGGATASDICYGTNVNFNNNFVALSNDVCDSSAEVTFTATDPCGQSARTTATFRITDNTSPVITVGASDAFFECSASNDNEVSQYLANRGGASATDSCTSIQWDNNFVGPVIECNGPETVVFTATDLCGNSATTIGSIEIDDTVLPNFSNFPADRTIFCDQSEDPSVTGRPGVFDACDSDVEPLFNDIQTQEPDERFCPGDIIITRTWSAVDDCGNVALRDQTITITIPVGTCTPTACPPCDDNICCESSLEPVPCNPVGCNPVPCTTTECGTVPCIPVVCSSGSTPIFGDDDDESTPAPIASPVPEPCDPVYIYVFDDDEGYDNPFEPQQVGSSTSSAGVISCSLFFIVLSVLMTMF